MIEAVVRHYKLEEIKDALGQSGCQGMTVFEHGEVRDPEDSSTRTITYRGMKFTQTGRPMVGIEICVCDERELKVFVSVIRACARTAGVGFDGFILVRKIDHVLRIRTGEQDEEAI